MGNAPPPGSGPRPANPAGVTPQDFFPGTAAAPTAPRFWRLTWEQYDNAISDLVGTAVHPSVDLKFPRELESGNGWLNEARYLEASDNLAPAFEAAADTYAPMLAGKLGSCAAADATCIARLVRDFGKRAWRRPVASDEVTRYAALYGQVVAEYDAPTATEMVVKAMLQSPFFLFRQEAGDPSKVAGGNPRLTPHEIASALSFGLWNRPPDAELMAAADSGQLQNQTTITAQIRRLLADRRAHDAFRAFVGQWVGSYRVKDVKKNQMLFAEWSPQVAAAMADETNSFVSSILDAGGGSYRNLLLAGYSFPPRELSWIYGQNVTGAKVDTPHRAGLLMQPSVLAVHATEVLTSPTQRGIFVVKKLACFTPSSPPPNVGDPPPPSATTTTRQRFEEHRADPVCASCHGFFDPVGLTFENFDSAGRYRTTENGLPIDPSARLSPGVFGPKEVDLTDAFDVARTLADSPTAHQCLARRAFQYFWGRQDGTGDDPVLRKSMQALLGADFDIRELVAALAGSDDYFVRRPVTP